MNDSRCPTCGARPLGGWCGDCGASPPTAGVVPAEKFAATLRLLAEAQPGGTMPPGDAQQRWWDEVKALMLEHCL